jgi:hypothetical protein
VRDLTIVSGLSPSQTTFALPNLVNKSITLRGAAGAELGTLFITAQQGFGFQAAYRSEFTNSVVLGLGSESYSANMNIGAVMVSGAVSIPTASTATSMTWNLSFSGTGTGSGLETHNYHYDGPQGPNSPPLGTMETEQWQVNITQQVSFTGTITEYWSAGVPWPTMSSMTGTFNEQDTASWTWASDHLDPHDPMHQTYMAPTGPLGVTLDLHVTKPNANAQWI